ncbi:MAG: 50S ribosomal protein L11 methyltransferase [Candidatus Xenobiia bacterium LiM19]
MKYTEITITCDVDAMPFLEHILMSHMIQGWVEQHALDYHAVLFYLPEEGASSQAVAALSLEIEKMDGARLSSRVLDGEDWEHSWKRHIKTQRVGRFIIKPTWEQFPALAPGEIVIELDPGMAFGTGDHATTAMCLEMLERYLCPGDSVLDMGTGSAILSIASLYLNAGQVTAVDYDPVALTVADENLVHLGLRDKVTLLCNDVTTIREGAFDLVLGNIFLREVLSVLNQHCPPLKSGGIFIGSGITYEQVPRIEEALRSVPFDLLVMEKRDIWAAFAVRKR